MVFVPGKFFKLMQYVRVWQEPTCTPSLWGVWLLGHVKVLHSGRGRPNLQILDQRGQTLQLIYCSVSGEGKQVLRHQLQAGFFSNDKRNGSRLRDRVLAGSVGSVDHSSDEETKTATLPSGKIKLLVVDRVTRRLEKNQQIFQRIAQKRPKHLQQSSI